MSTKQKIPDFRLPASTGHTLEFEAFQGKVPLVLVFLAEPRTSDGERLLAELDRRLKDFGSERCQLLVIVKETARDVRELADRRGLAVPILADASGAMARDFDADHSSVAVVADRDGNIERRFDPLDVTESKTVVENLLGTVRAMEDGGDRQSADTG